MRNDFESNYLMHHGILGQKWGHQNGPPYPLDEGDHSSSEKKAGYKKSIGGGRNEDQYDRPSKVKQFKNRLNRKDYKKAKSEFTSLKRELAEAKYRAELHKIEAEDAKTHPAKYKKSSKSISKQAAQEAKQVAEYEKKINDLLDKYGHMKIDNSSSQKKLNDVSKWYEDELKKMK